MTEPMKYKGYTAKIEYDNDSECFGGIVLDINDMITFYGENVKELQQAFKDSVDVYLEYCEERGEDPERPYNGKFSIRVSPELHKMIALKSGLCGASMNKYITKVLEKAVSGDQTFFPMQQRGNQTHTP